MRSGHTIRQKIALAIAASLGIGLLLSFLTFSVREIDQRRQAKTAELFSMADVVAFNAKHRDRKSTRLNSSHQI